MDEAETTIHGGVLNVGHHEALGYYAEVPAGMADEMSSRIAEQGSFCRVASQGELPCAENHAALVFGMRNPRSLRLDLEEALPCEVAVAASHWPYAEDGYSDAVDAVLRLGNALERKFDYAGMGITEAHIPELVEAVCDPAFAYCQEGDAYAWAGVHPLLALEAFPRIPVGAAKALIGQLTRIDDEDDDWCSNHGPRILGKIGADAIPLLLKFIDDPVGDGVPFDEDAAFERQDRYLYARVAALDALQQTGENFPECRGRCVQSLVALLMRHARQSRVFNAFIVSKLVDLKAIQAAGLIGEAFRADHVDPSVVGDLEDVRIALGLQIARTTPQPKYGWDMLEDGDEDEEEEDALEPFRREEAKIGRNDPCPCGSGKKHKKCCGKNV